MILLARPLNGTWMTGHILSIILLHSPFTENLNIPVNLKSLQSYVQLNLSHPVYKDHNRDQWKDSPYTQVVFIYRFNGMENVPLGPKCGLYKQVVFILYAYHHIWS